MCYVPYVLEGCVLTPVCTLREDWHMSLIMTCWGVKSFMSLCIKMCSVN